MIAYLLLVGFALALFLYVTFVPKYCISLELNLLGWLLLIGLFVSFMLSVGTAFF